MKDLVVKLEHDKAHDQALSFAVSVAGRWGPGGQVPGSSWPK